MKRKLVLEVTHNELEYMIRVIVQTHIGSDFGNPTCDFVASTGFTLASCTCPEVYGGDDVLYVRGDNPTADDQPVFVNGVDLMQRIMHAVREYNSYALVGKLPDVSTDAGTFIVE